MDLHSLWHGLDGCGCFWAWGGGGREQCFGKITLKKAQK